MKDIAAEAREEAKEASEPGARGKEYRDKERMGDEGQAYARGGYMPEETERSEKERGKHQMGKAVAAEKEPKGASESEANESYEDVRKRGGKVRKRRKGGILPLDGGKEHMTNELQTAHHQARKAGGLVRGGATKERPDRRARGGATSDLRPETAAGKMSQPDYLKQHELPRNKGHGTDTKGRNRA